MTSWKSHVAAVLFCLTFLSCSRSGHIPSDIIDRDKMSEILFDVAMAEGHVEHAHFRDSAKSRDSIFRIELDRVMTMHGVTSSSFVSSYRFYTSHPHHYKVLIDSLHARTQRDQQKMYLQPGERRRKKSVKRGKSI